MILRAIDIREFDLKKYKEQLIDIQYQILVAKMNDREEISVENSLMTPVILFIFNHAGYNVYPSGSNYTIKW